jgi:hypothetical protein
MPITRGILTGTLMAIATTADSPPLYATFGCSR